MHLAAEVHRGRFGEKAERRFGAFLGSGGVLEEAIGVFAWMARGAGAARRLESG